MHRVIYPKSPSQTLDCKCKLTGETSQLYQFYSNFISRDKFAYSLKASTRKGKNIQKYSSSKIFGRGLAGTLATSKIENFETYCGKILHLRCLQRYQLSYCSGKLKPGSEN